MTDKKAYGKKSKIKQKHGRLLPVLKSTLLGYKHTMRISSPQFVGNFIHPSSICPPDNEGLRG